MDAFGASTGIKERMPDSRLEGEVRSPHCTIRAHQLDERLHDALTGLIAVSADVGSNVDIARGG